MGPAEPRLSADARGRRIDAATGIVAVVLFAAAGFVAGTPPTAESTADEIARFLTDNRDRIGIAAFLAGLAIAYFLWWLGSLRYWLRRGEGGEGRLSAAAFLAGGIAAGLTLSATAVEAGLAFRVAGQGDQALVRALFDIRGALDAMSSFGYAAFIAAAACSGARSGKLPGSAYWSGSVIAGVNAASASALFADRGVFATGELVSRISLVATVAWIVAVALLMIRRP